MDCSTQCAHEKENSNVVAKTAKNVTFLYKKVNIMASTKIVKNAKMHYLRRSAK